MSNYIVDSADLTSVANAIRTKGGTSAQLAFPADFVQAIEDIETGDGGDTYAQFLSGQLVTYESADVTNLNVAALKRVYLPNLTTVSGRYPFIDATSICLPKAIGGSFGYSNNVAIAKVTKLVVGGHTRSMSAGGSFQRLNSLEAADITGGGRSDISMNFSNYFTDCSKLATLILRPKYIVPVSYNQYSGPLHSTPFDSGKSGGTIYIPKDLYDHLGDGSNLDYKAATSWSTYDGFGTITWAQIEGSIYETQYADGTPIPTA